MVVGRNGDPVARLDDYASVTLNGEKYPKTVRSVRSVKCAKNI